MTTVLDNGVICSALLPLSFDLISLLTPRLMKCSQRNLQPSQFIRFKLKFPNPSPVPAAVFVSHVKNHLEGESGGDGPALVPSVHCEIFLLQFC